MEVFRQLSQSLASGQLRALVIGGHAVGALARRRYTNDVDLLIATSDESALTTTLAVAGYRKIAANALVIRYVHSDLLEPPVDALLVNDTTFARLWQDSRETTVEGHAVRIPSPMNLVALKLHAIRQDGTRFPQDAADIAAIVAAHRETFDDATLTALCERFGGAGAWERLRPLLPQPRP